MLLCALLRRVAEERGTGSAHDAFSPCCRRARWLLWIPYCKRHKSTLAIKSAGRHDGTFVKGMALIARPAVAWLTVALFLSFGKRWLGDFGSALWSASLFLWLFGVILWCAFGVVGEADHLAELLAEPLGTLILTLSIVIIEVVLIGAVALGGESAPTLGRDTMFAVLMIVLNGAIGLCLLSGGLRHHEQAYNLQGAVAYLAVIIPLSAIALILPNFTRAFPAGSLTLTQAAFFSLFTVLLYGIFLALQTRRHLSAPLTGRGGTGVSGSCPGGQHLNGYPTMPETRACETFGTFVGI
jgi:hypothetical protein